MELKLTQNSCKLELYRIYWVIIFDSIIYIFNSFGALCQWFYNNEIKNNVLSSRHMYGLCVTYQLYMFICLCVNIYFLINNSKIYWNEK